MTDDGLAPMPPGAAMGDLITDPSGDGAPAPEAVDERSRRRRKALLLLLLGMLAMLVTVATWYLLFRKPIETIIPPVEQQAMPHYSLSIYGTNQPIGVAVSPAGDRIYVADSAGTRTVLIFDGSGTLIGALKPAPSTGDAHTPVYVAIEPVTGDIYVSDRSSGGIYVYAADGSYREAFPAKVNDGFLPLGLAFDRDGHLLASDVGGPYHRLIAFDKDGSILRTYGEEGQLNFPNGIAVDAEGRIYVADSGNGRVVVFDKSGKGVTGIARGVAAGNLGTPRGVAVDDSGRLLVVDTTAHAVNIYRVAADPAEARPTYVGTFGTVGRADGAFEFPFAVATDSRARIYVSDWGNDRIQVWSY